MKRLVSYNATTGKVSKFNSLPTTIVHAFLPSADCFQNQHFEKIFPEYC